MSNPMSPERALDAAIFHGRLVQDAPYTCGPLPPDILRTLAEAASEQVNVHTIMSSTGYTQAERTTAVSIALATMWAAGFKAGAQAAGPAD